MPKVSCGSRTARKGGRLPFSAKTVHTLIKTMNPNASVMPMARCTPSPPRVLRDEIATPIKVITMNAKGLSLRIGIGLHRLVVTVEGSYGNTLSFPQEVDGVVYYLVGAYTLFQFSVLVVGVLLEEYGTLLVDVVVERTNLHTHSRLEVQVAVEAALRSVDVLVLEHLELYVAARYDEVAYEQNSYGENQRAVQIGPQHTSVADAAAQNGDNLCVAGHLRCEEQRRDKHKQRAVQVEEVGDEVEIVFEYNFAYRGLVLDEVIQFFRHVERDDNDDDKYQPQQERL